MSQDDYRDHCKAFCPDYDDGICKESRTPCSRPELNLLTCDECVFYNLNDFKNLCHNPNPREGECIVYKEDLHPWGRVLLEILLYFQFRIDCEHIGLNLELLDELEKEGRYNDE